MTIKGCLLGGAENCPLQHRVTYSLAVEAQQEVEAQMALSKQRREALDEAAAKVEVAGLAVRSMVLVWAMTSAIGLRGGLLRAAMAVLRGFKYSRKPSRPPSRPKPDSRCPPNPQEASN